MRSVFSRLAVLSLAAGAAGLVAVGCSTKSDKPETANGNFGDPDHGTVGLNLQVAPNAEVTSIHYVVTQNGMPITGVTEPTSGDIPVPGNNQDFYFALSLPTGAGYAIALTADWDDPDDADTAIDIHCEGGFGTFAVVGGSETAVNVAMQCVDVGSGDVIIGVDVTSTACPDLIWDYASVNAKSTTIGTPVEVRSLAHHLVAGTSIAYAWTVSPAAAGNFVAPGTANTSFNCATASAAGTPHQLTVTATAGGCQDTLTLPLSCANLLCGNGVTDPGETCDDAGAAGGCPNDCTQICGDNNQEGTEVCDFDVVANPNGTATCTLGCTVRTQVCGDGFITAPETCDDGNTTPGDACDYPSCTPPAAADMCNDGVTTTLFCDRPYIEADCGQTCGEIENAACTTCQGATCAFANCETLTGVTTEAFTGGPPIGTPHAQLCREALDCMYRTNCAALDPLDCYCGTSLNCGSAPTGACFAELQRSLETNVFANIEGRFTDGAYAGGVANGRIDCVKASGCGSAATCGALP
jgi:cysteine-rich repeat protein